MFELNAILALLLARMLSQEGNNSGSSISVDKTLTKSGAAADAAVVGEKFEEQSKAISNKADNTGWTPDKYIVTDKDGKLAEKDDPTASYTTEEWTFTLDDDSTVTKKVVLG